jgi:hypothetical protein
MKRLAMPIQMNPSQKGNLTGRFFGKMATGVSLPAEEIKI